MRILSWQLAGVRQVWISKVILKFAYDYYGRHFDEISRCFILLTLSIYSYE